MQTRGNVISFCVLGLSPTHRSSSKKTVIELYSSYQEISRLIANSSCASIGSYSQLVSNQYSLSQLSNSIVLDDNINVYARTLNESGNKYLCVIYYKDVPFIHSLKKSSNLQLLDESISTFIALLTHNKSNVSTNVLTNIQSCIDLLSSINAQYSHDARDLVYWDNRCKHYTQTVTKSTLNKQPIATTPFKSQPYYSQDTPTHTRRHGLLFDDPKYTKRQRYKPRNNQSYNDTPRGYERSKSYHSIKKNTITPPQYKWSRKSTTDITDIEQANAKETEAKQADVETPKPSSKYDTTLSQLTKDFSELSQLVSELQLNTKDEEEDQENDEDREPPKNNGNVLQLNKGLVQSGAGIQQSPRKKFKTNHNNPGSTLTPLSTSAACSVSSSSDVTSSNMSRCTSDNSPSGGVKALDEDFASNIPIRKRGGRHRSRSSVDDVMNECDDALKQHYHAMMGTIGDDAAFKQKLKHLLVEVANNYSKSDEEEPEPMNTPQAQVTRQSLKIKQIKTDFVTEIINAERDEEIQDKYWNKLSWNFDPISFGEHAKVAGNTVVLLGWHLIRMNGWHTEFKVAPHKLITFLYQIQEAYHNDNWYHNKYHAADVMNNMYWYMTKCTSMDKHLDAFDRFIGVMAAVCHDVDHNGYNNSYHQRTKSYLAIRYNDQSILENHHISYSFKLISSDAHYNWISDLKDTALIERARKYLIRLILGTDMSLHKKHLNQIQTLKKKLVTDDGETVVMSEDDKINLLAIILHAADIANAAKTRSLCVEWAKRCIEEFRVQGDDEKRLFGKESQLLFDRKHPLEKSQVGWIKFVMLPYFTPLNELLKNDIKPQIDNLHNNLKQWTEYKEYQDDEKVNK
eukprot:859977_1